MALSQVYNKKADLLVQWEEHVHGLKDMLNIYLSEVCRASVSILQEMHQMMYNATQPISSF